MRRYQLFTLLGFAGLLLSPIVMLAGWMHQQDAVTMLRTQSATNARVVALSTQIGWASYRNPNANGGSDVVSVRFADAKGAPQNVGISEFVGSSEIANLRVGGSVPIVYDPSNPAGAHLKTSLLRLARPKTIAIGGVVFVVSLALLVGGLRLKRGVA